MLFVFIKALDKTFWICDMTVLNSIKTTSFYDSKMQDCLNLNCQITYHSHSQSV